MTYVHTYMRTLDLIMSRGHHNEIKICEQILCNPLNMHTYVYNSIYINDQLTLKCIVLQKFGSYCA